MSKELYLEAIEALRARVEAAESPDDLRAGLFLINEDGNALVNSRFDDYLDMAVTGADAEATVGGMVEVAADEVLEMALGLLSEWVKLKRDRAEIERELSGELASFFAAESAEYPPAQVYPSDLEDEEDDPCPDFEAFLHGDCPDEAYVDDDDPDYEDAYRDDEDEEGDGWQARLDDEKWQEADRRYEEDRLAEMERLRDDDDD